MWIMQQNLTDVLVTDSKSTKIFQTSPSYFSRAMIFIEPSLFFLNMSTVAFYFWKSFIRV